MMIKNNWAALLALTGLVGSLLTAGPAAADPAPSPKVAAALWDDVSGGQDSAFWVRFGQQADLSTAAGKGAKASRGTEVIRARKSAADSAQKRLIGILRAAKADFTPFWISNTILVKGGEALLKQIAELPEVAKVEPDLPIPLPDPVVAKQARALVDGIEWNVAKIRADQVWSDYSRHGEGIVVANIDSGVQWNHPALVNQYRGSGGAVSHDHNWYDPAGECLTPAPCDNTGHGTHTMGTMAGDDGGANKIGIAPGVKWIAAKACEGSTCTAASLLAAGQWMLAPTDLSGANPRPDLAPDVVNNSWGGMGYSEWYADVLYSWVQAGIFPAFAIGNDGPDCGTAGSPGQLSWAYSSAAFDASDQIAPFSSRGSGLPYIKPDIAAPGVDVRSSLPGGGYGIASGTSMASPHTAATVALVWSAVPSLRGMVDLTRRILDNSAVPVADTSCASAGSMNEVWGHGKLDAYTAVAQAVSGLITPGTELPLDVGYNYTLPGTPDHWGFHSVDEDPATYWEIPGNLTFAGINLAFPGGRRTTDKLVVQLPAGEPARTVTIGVESAYQGSADYFTVLPAQSYSFNPATGNQVTITFPPVHGCCVRLSFPDGPWAQSIKIAEVRAYSASGTNAALSRPVQASAQPGHPAASAVDGNASTYWESANNAFPQSFTVDLGATCRIYQVEMALPPGWGVRTQTLSIEGSDDGVTYSPIVASRPYVFNPAAANTAAVSFNVVRVRYVRLVVTANTGWPAGQLSELRIRSS